MRYLSMLKPGTRFRLAEMHEVTGVLVMVNDCRAVVRLDRPDREVEFVDHAGETRQFKSRGSLLTSWAPTTMVEPIGSQNQEEETMSKTTKTKTPKTATKAKAEKTPNAAKTKTPKGDGKLSCIDAAAKVLGEAQEPMNTKQMIEQMASKEYWTSPGGQTPAATLYSAILREIQQKGKEARFRKADRGLFALNGTTPNAKPAKTRGKKAPADGEPGPQAVAELFKL